MRKKVSILIDNEVLEKSRRLGINVSKACENYLKQLIEAIEGTHNKNSFLAPDSFTKEAGVVRSPRFEPGSSAWQGTADDWNSFHRWIVEKKYRGSHGTTLFNYAQQYSDCLFKQGEEQTLAMGKVRDLSDSMRPNILKALSALAKFTGQYENWKKLIKDYGLSWSGKSADDIIIERLTNVQDPDEIWRWIRQVKEERQELTDFMDLMSYTGLRYVEAVHSCQLIRRLSIEGKLDSYFVQKKSTLEHFRFKDIFIRNSKKAFVSFVPPELVKSISDAELFLNPAKAVKRLGIPQRFGDIREAHGTFMTKYLKPSEIDFLHGRVTSNVFMTNYFNPALIGDLKARAFQGIAGIQEKVKV